MNDRHRCISLCLALALTLLCAVRTAYAAVYTVPEDSGAADTVYVAGNPDAYPLEYYSREDNAFCGVFPNVLKAVSEKTGISFTYIAASEVNRQKELSRNGQVELVTALPAGQDECEVAEVLPVLEISAHGRKSVYGIGFTEIASPELAGAIKSALSEISEEEKMGYLLAASENDPKVSSQSRFIKIILFSAAAFFAIICGVTAVIAARRKKHDREALQLDGLTGVGNGKYYEYAFERLLSPQSRALCAVVYLACEAKKISAGCGQKAAEDIQRYAAAHLNAGIASAEYLARVGDGIFVMLIQAPTEKECMDRATAMVDSLNQYIKGFYPNMENTFRAGVSRLCDHPDCNAETALYNAEQGYLAARRKGERVKITAGSELAQSRKREKLRASISKAVSDGEFRVYLQFIHENRTGKICGAEALSRWKSREHGVLRPQEYMDILKESGQIIAHDYKIFSSVCRQLEVWNAAPYDRLFLTCNFTRASLSRADFADHVAEIASGYQFEHSRLVLEITEDSIAENAEAVSENIRSCRALGFRVAIDDMGTGFTSFADVYNNEVDFVKIDREFIPSCTSERQQTILSNIVTLVHQSGAKVLCEGVETPEQAEFLNGIHCDMMQGFYFSRILPLMECESFLKNRSITDTPVFQAADREQHTRCDL